MVLEVSAKCDEPGNERPAVRLRINRIRILVGLHPVTPHTGAAGQDNVPVYLLRATEYRLTAGHQQYVIPDTYAGGGGGDAGSGNHFDMLAGLLLTSPVGIQRGPGLRNRPYHRARSCEKLFTATQGRMMRHHSYGKVTPRRNRVTPGSGAVVVVPRRIHSNHHHHLRRPRPPLRGR